VTEQLRGDQRRRDGGAVDADEGTRRPRRPFVNGARDELLARSRLTVMSTVESVRATCDTWAVQP
jgi:hypothetical protein